MLSKIVSYPVYFFYAGATYRVGLNLKLLKYFKARKWRRASILVTNNLQKKYGVFVSVNSDLGNDLKLPHPVGIVIGDGVKLGNNVTIFQNVTVGGARIGDAQARNYPTIGDGTVVFAGAVVIGNVNIGKNCVIGANSVVFQDIPDNCTAVGAPARIIRKNLQ